MKSLIVTGGYGFIGSNFVHFEASRYDTIHNIDCMTYAAHFRNLAGVQNVQNHLWDISMKYNIPKIRKLIIESESEWLVHFAAESHVDNSIDSPSDFFDTNVRGTLNILEAIEGTGTKLLYISTDEVYGSLPLHVEPCHYSTEVSSHHPNSPYAASKAAAEQMVMGYGATYDIPYIITNGSNTYGPHQHQEKFIPKVIWNALRNKKIPIYGTGKNIRDWIYVEDVCSAIYHVMSRGRINSRYNIGTFIDTGADTPLVKSEPISNYELADFIVKCLEVPPSLLEMVTDRPAHDLRYNVNSTKLHDDTGWYPRVGLIEGLKRTIQWYKENPRQ